MAMFVSANHVTIKKRLHLNLTSRIATISILKSLSSILPASSRKQLLQAAVKGQEENKEDMQRVTASLAAVREALWDVQ